MFLTPNYVVPTLKALSELASKHARFSRFAKHANTREQVLPLVEVHLRKINRGTCVYFVQA